MTTTMKVSFLQRLFDVPVARCCPICHAPLSVQRQSASSKKRKRQRRNKQKLMNNSKRNQRKNFKTNLKMIIATVGKGC